MRAKPKLVMANPAMVAVTPKDEAKSGSTGLMILKPMIINTEVNESVNTISVALRVDKGMECRPFVNEVEPMITKLSL